MGYTTVTVEARDIAGQRAIRLTDFGGDRMVDELVNSAVSRLELPTRDTEGRPFAFAARLERTGEQLFPSELVGEVLEPGDRVQIAPDISAGGPSVEGSGR